MQIIIKIALSIVFLSIVSTIDLKRGIIPNYLTFPTIGLGLVISLILDQGNLFGIIVCFAVLFIMGCIGVCGFGDIKALMVITALNGWKIATISFVLSQVIMVCFLFCKMPKATVDEFKNTAPQIFNGGVTIDTTKKRHVYAPYLLAGYIISVLIIQLWR